MTKTADDYLSLPYHIALVHDRDEEGNEGWIAEIEELPGCITQADSPVEALDRISGAMVDWISVALEEGREIPEPRGESAYSGRFVVRIPR